MEWIFLVLVAVVLVFGFGVVVWNRRRAGLGEADATPVLPSRPSSPPSAVRPEPVVAEPSETPAGDEPTDTVGVVEPVAERATFRNRMAKARGALTGAFLGIRGRRGITDDTWDDLEEALLRADVGVRVTDELLSGLKARVKSKEITEPDALLSALQAEMVSRLEGADRSLQFVPGDPDSPNVWLFVGVNGVGKTTTIGKVANQQRSAGRSVLMAAGDTFRAAAAEQLATWAERSGAEIVRGNEGGDPSSVIFDGIERAGARNIDLVLGDTAGRLHTKTNLMDELRKVRRVAAKGKGRVTEVLLVIDATTGQNGLTQAREFGAATTVDGEGGVTGVVLTKLDGSAKGGIVFAIETELGLPVKLVGLGETIGDLVPFDPTEFVDALFATD
ncbi:MAG TPA: signal recognition particle-docking protein FtsY [Acidimicrobiaceae bacterium]|nr:signal recognition particle-docking protein FtsY [Acidimicrobiaceae bacterium]